MQCACCLVSHCLCLHPDICLHVSNRLWQRQELPDHQLHLPPGRHGRADEQLPQGSCQGQVPPAALCAHPPWRLRPGLQVRPSSPVLPASNISVNRKGLQDAHLWACEGPADIAVTFIWSCKGMHVVLPDTGIPGKIKSDAVHHKGIVVCTAELL